MESSEQLRLVVDAAPIAIVVAEANGSIALANEQACRLFGYEGPELLGKPVEELVPERFRRAHGGLRAGYLAAPVTRAMGVGRDLFGLRKDGTEVPIEIGLNPIVTAQGRFTVATVVDITERKNAEEMRRERDRALDASNLKSQFVATMSHELRTPLNAIIASAELLSSTQLEERQRAFVETIDESAEALLALISSILDFSKIEAGKLDLDARVFELEALVEGAAAVLTQQVRQKKLQLHVDVDPSIPGVLRGDAGRLRQILLNLIANAVKFTASGRVVVRAVPVETSSRHAVVRFEVEDTGIGIHPDVVPKLFEPFVQGDSSSSRRFGGTGLGLSISKRLAELMQGEIGVVSEPERGSLFWFTARFDVATTAPAAADAPAARALNTERKVLVAEDNESLREILVHQFAKLGVPVTLVANGRDAVDALRREPFSLVFMDCHMPEMDGFDATRAMRALESDTARHVPIVAMTANAFREDRDACLAAGMDDYLAKPVRIGDLRGMIERWMAQQDQPATA